MEAHYSIGYFHDNRDLHRHGLLLADGVDTGWELMDSVLGGLVLLNPILFRIETCLLSKIFALLNLGSLHIKL